MSQRGSWVFRDGKLIPKHEALRRDFAIISHARSNLPAPMVVSDTIGEFVSHIDGRTRFDSKSAWQKHCKAHGYEIVGNDRGYTGTPYIGSKEHRRDVQRDVLEAFDKVEQNHPAPPLEKTNEFGDVNRLLEAGERGEIVRGDVSGDWVGTSEPAKPKAKPKRGGRKSKRG